MIDATAIIGPGAEIASDVEIGPYCIIGSDVKLESGVKLYSHVCIVGDTHIGARTKIYPFACIGYEPQDLKYAGESSTVRIGADNIIREHVTIHRGTMPPNGIMTTVIGNKCLIMAGSHVAHDCVVGDEVIMANNVGLAGHVTVGKYAVIGGLSGIHQFVRIGEMAIIGAGSVVTEDVAPFCHVFGNRALLKGLNLTGMRRHNFSHEEIRVLDEVYKMIFESTDDSKTLIDRVKAIPEDQVSYKSVDSVLTFLINASKRGTCMPGPKAKRTNRASKANETIVASDNSDI